MNEPKRLWKISPKASGRERAWIAPRYLILSSIVATYCLVATVVSSPTSALGKDVELAWNWLAQSSRVTGLQGLLFGNDAEDGGALVVSATEGVGRQRGNEAEGQAVGDKDSRQAQVAAGEASNASDDGHQAAEYKLGRLGDRSHYGHSTGSVGGQSGLERAGGAKSDSEVLTLEQAYLDENYTAKLSHDGGEPPLRARLSKGRLPSGLAIADDSPVLFGKPQAIGSYVFAVAFQDSLDQIYTAYYRLEVVKREEDKESEPLKVLTMALRAGVVGQEYAAQVESEGGKLPKLFVMSGLADGLYYNPNTGLIYGIPEKAGLFTVEVIVTTADSEQASAQLPMVIDDEPLEVVTAALPPAMLGGSYAFQLEARGGYPPYFWSLTGGSLPNGLVLDSSGSLSGTVNGTAHGLAVGATGERSNVQAGSSGGGDTAKDSISMRVTVMDRNKAADSVDLRLQVESGELQIVTDALPDAEVNRYYFTELKAVGGMPPYVWQMGARAGGSAAAQSSPWLAISASGSISGTPSAAGQDNIQIKLRDASGEARSRAVTLKVVDKALTIAPLSANDISSCTAITTQLEASGGQPPYSWLLVSSELSGASVSPNGLLSLPSQVNLNGGVAGGENDPQGGASAGESAKLIVQVLDASGATASYTATVPGSPAPLRVLSLGDISCPVGVYCREQLLGSGGCPPYTWSVEAGSLVPGLALTAAGLLSGVAEQDGKVTGAAGDGAGGSATSQDSSEQLKVSIMDSVGSKAVAPITLYTLSDSALSIDTKQLPEGRVGEAYQAQLTAAGGTGALLWSIAGGGLPEGVHLNSQTGALQGVPTKDGVYSLTMRVTDSRQVTTIGTAQANLELIVANAELAILPDTLQPPHGKVGTLWQHMLRAVGGKPPYRWEVSQAGLPLGLTFDMTSMMIVGTPEKSGNVQIPIVVTDSENAEIRAELTVGFDAEELKILTTELQPVTVGEFYTEELLFSGGTAPFSWRILAGELPDGLLLSDDGVISGVVGGNAVSGGQDEPHAQNAISIELRDSSGDAVVQSVFLEVLTNAYSPVTNLVAVGSDGKVGLSWDNPGDPEFAKARIVRSTVGVPTDPFDGAIVYEGINNNALDVDLENGESYYYAAFAEYSGGNAGENFSALGSSSSTSAAPRLVSEQGKPDACIDEVVAFAPLDRTGAYGAKQLPGIVLGFPQGGGEYAGGSGVVSLNSRVNDDNGRSAPYGGSITLRFTDNIVLNGNGVDFTIFENAIHPRNSNEYFIEPAIVEVSVNGRDFFLFPFDFVPHYKADGSLNLALPDTYRTGFAGVRPVYANGSNPSPSNPTVSGGDSFDLSSISAVKLTWVQYVRITATGDNWLRDVNGDLVRHTNESPTWGASGRGNSGFDLDAVCAVNY